MIEKGGNKMGLTKEELGRRHRELVARKSRETSMLSRDIAPIPMIKNAKRRIKAQKNFRFFCEEYFPKKFKLKWSSYHLEVIKWLEETLKQGRGKLALAMPRGSGKTTLIETAVLWAVLVGHVRFIVVIGATVTEAKRIIDSIKASLINNKAILEDFPEAVFPFRKLNGSALLARGQLYLGELTGIEWKPSSITFAKIPGSLSSGANIVAVGIHGAVRGKNKDIDEDTARPDTIILDDPQTDDDAINPDRVIKLEKKINSTIEGLVGPGEEMAMFMACTIIQDGDLASRYLNRKEYPQWRGLIYKMVEKMPERMDLWEKYRDIRKNEDEVAATMFYKKHRTEMQKGAVVAWEANYTDRDLDALQYAMNKWSDNYEGFMSEYQNEPVRPGAGTVIADPKTICSRLNGFERLVIPMETAAVTGFIDVHDDILYYAVTAWASDFTGYVIDYGTYPEQKRRVFNKKDRDLIVMKKIRENATKQEIIFEGIKTHLLNLLSSNFRTENEEQDNAEVRFTKILVDSGYVPEVVEQAIRVTKTSAVLPSKGVGVKSINKPMRQWQRVTARIFGTYWIVDRPQGRSLRTATYDTNYWKCRLHEAFGVGLGGRGGLTLWGEKPETHRMLADHCNSEIAKFVESGENKVYEWQLIPGRDNHLMDCLVGCMVGASTCGIKLATEQKTPERKVFKQ